MTLYPAIDLKDGKAVRLTKGLMDSAKIYSDEPWSLVKTFEEMGAEWVHLVDLNGAFAGEPKNLEQIIKISGFDVGSKTLSACRGLYTS
jgi:phosphoribosylformimino-5-aminoimidazole carboxamide ribotide isomerase